MAECWHRWMTTASGRFRRSRWGFWWWLKLYHWKSSPDDNFSLHMNCCCRASRTASSSQSPGTWFMRSMTVFGIPVVSNRQNWSPVGKMVFSRSCSPSVFIVVRSSCASIGAITIKECSLFSFTAEKALEIVILSRWSGFKEDEMSTIDCFEAASNVALDLKWSLRQIWSKTIRSRRAILFNFEIRPEVVSETTGLISASALLCESGSLFLLKVLWLLMHKKRKQSRSLALILSFVPDNGSFGDSSDIPWDVSTGSNGLLCSLTTL